MLLNVATRHDTSPPMEMCMWESSVHIYTLAKVLRKSANTTTAVFVVLFLLDT